MKNLPYMHLRLRALRLSRHFNTSDVADRLGISRAYYTQIEGGTREPSEELVKKFMELYELKSLKQLTVSHELIKDIKAVVNVADLTESLAALDAVYRMTTNSGDSGAK